MFVSFISMIHAQTNIKLTVIVRCFCDSALNRSTPFVERLQTYMSTPLLIYNEIKYQRRFWFRRVLKTRDWWGTGSAGDGGVQKGKQGCIMTSRNHSIQQTRGPEEFHSWVSYTLKMAFVSRWENRCSRCRLFNFIARTWEIFDTWPQE